MVTKQSQLMQLDGFTVECKLGPTMVVFSHGFGVRRDSRGMFTDLVGELPKGFGFVLFDYNRPEGDMLRLTGLSEQVARLTQVIDWVRRQPEVARVVIIAHSKGCTVTALARPVNVDGVIMLAPPLHVGSGTRTLFTTRLGTTRQGDTWTVPRSDGTTSLIDESVFAEMDDVNGEEVVLTYAKARPLYVIGAGNDRVLPDQDYSRVAACPGMTIDMIPGASHDFEGTARQPLIRLVNTYLQKVS